jgi:hypothetical protein
MTVKLLADNVPVGTPIPIEVQGIGWRERDRALYVAGRRPARSARDRGRAF